MRFLVDNQLPAALARYLTSRGVDCDHVIDIGLAEANDLAIWDHCRRNGAILISKDTDFVYMANASDAGARLVWVRLGNCRTKALLAAVESVWSRIEAALRDGERIVELR